jgi:NTP pyrophosphatase (non-canonical NTP hydrolase)
MLNNELTPQEQELLVITMEECCELAMVCSKLLRFGKEQKNLDNLVQESADVTVMINMLSAYKLVSPVEKLEQMFKKQDKLKEWSSLY